MGESFNNQYVLPITSNNQPQGQDVWKFKIYIFLNEPTYTSSTKYVAWSLKITCGDQYLCQIQCRENLMKINH